ILVISSSPVIRRNRIDACNIRGDGTESWQYGGGIAVLFGSGPLIEENTISNNILEAGYSEFPPYSSGGGVYCDITSAAVVRNCTIRRNASGNGGGGGVGSDSPDLHLLNCTVESNHGFAGGFASRGVVDQCVIRDNVGTWPYGTGGCYAEHECQITSC